MFETMPKELPMLLAVTNYTKLNEWFSDDGETYFALMAKCLDIVDGINIGDVASLQNVEPMSELCYECIKIITEAGKIEDYFFIVVKKSPLGNYVIDIYTDTIHPSPMLQQIFIGGELHMTTLELSTGEIPIIAIKDLHGVHKNSTARHVTENMLEQMLDDGYVLSNVIIKNYII